jgi:hypothetical protein
MVLNTSSNTTIILYSSDAGIGIPVGHESYVLLTLMLCVVYTPRLQQYNINDVFQRCWYRYSSGAQVICVGLARTVYMHRI